MHKRNGRYTYSPTDLTTLMESEYVSWMDRFYLDFPDKITPDPEDEFKKLLYEAGNAHEKAYLSKLRDSGKDVCEIIRGDAAIQTTLDAIHAGREVIYQAALQLDNFVGYADFLIRDGSAPGPNGYPYQVWDTKLALNPKPHYMIQLCAYAEMLQAIQGEPPKTIGVVLGNGQEQTFQPEDFYSFYLTVKEAFLKKQLAFDPEKPPEPTGKEDYGRWTSYAEKHLEEIDHLSRVAKIRTAQIEKLQKVGITTMQQLATTELGHVASISDDTFKMLKQQARLQVASIGLSCPAYEHIKPSASDPRTGLASLPPASPADVCFDMESIPDIGDSLEYLFGVTYLENGKLHYKDWWGHDRNLEKLAFEKFVDWVHARWKNNPSMHIFHYGSYEVGRLRGLSGRHTTRECEVDELLRSEVLVDLLTVVRQSLRVGTSGYSLKNIERLYKDERSGGVQTAGDSVVQYAQWRKTKDGKDHNESQILSNIRAYNREDCESTWQLLELLRKHQMELVIPYISKQERLKKKGEESVTPDQATEFADQDLSTLPEDEHGAECHRLQKLLAHLLKFH